VKKKYHQGSKVLSIVIDTRAYLQGEFLKSKSRTFSHSEIYLRGLQAALADLVERGVPLPEEPFDILLRIKQDSIDMIESEKEAIVNLKKKHRERASRTLAGQPIPKSEEVKESYVFDTLLECNGRYPDTLIASDPDRFKPAKNDSNESSKESAPV